MRRILCSDTRLRRCLRDCLAAIKHDLDCLRAMFQPYKAEDAELWDHMSGQDMAQMNSAFRVLLVRVEKSV